MGSLDDLNFVRGDPNKMCCLPGVISSIATMIDNSSRLFGDKKIAGTTEWALMRSTLRAPFKLDATIRSVDTSLKKVETLSTGNALTFISCY